MDPVQVIPYADEMPCAGTRAPKADQIDDLIRLLVTIRKRFGNTAIQYRVSWGGSALWVADELHQRITKLEKQVARLKKKVAAAEHSGGQTP